MEDRSHRLTHRARAGRTARRTALRIIFLGLVLTSAPPLHAGPCEPSCRIVVVDRHPHEVLAEWGKELGVEIELEGSPRETITAEIEEPSVERLIRSLASRGGYLVTRRGDRYTFYGDDLDEAVVTHPLDNISAAEAEDQLGRFTNVDTSVLRDANSLVLRGSSEELRAAVELLETIDQPRPNVFLELLVVEYFHGDSFTWAFDIIEGTKSRVSDLSYVPGLGNLSGLYEVIADLPEAFRLNLTALVADNEARVVTNPHVAVRNGEPGRIDFEEELHVILSNETENFGVTRTLEELEAGVELEVTPQILASRLVDLEVSGEVAVFVRAPEGQFAIDRQTVTTKVLVESGSTLVIGGLVTRKMNREESGVPFLRRIPLIGRLFEQELVEERYVETVVYITPYIGDPSAFSPERIGADVEAAFTDR